MFIILCIHWGSFAAKPKIASFLAPQTTGQYCCYAAPRVQTPRPNSTCKCPIKKVARAQTIKRQSCQILFFTIKRAGNSLTVYCGSKTSSYVRQTTALIVAIASGGPRRPRCGPASPMKNDGIQLRQLLRPPVVTIIFAGNYTVAAPLGPQARPRLPCKFIGAAPQTHLHGNYNVTPKGEEAANRPRHM